MSGVCVHFWVNCRPSHHQRVQSLRCRYFSISKIYVRTHTNADTYPMTAYRWKCVVRMTSAAATKTTYGYTAYGIPHMLRHFCFFLFRFEIQKNFSESLCKSCSSEFSEKRIDGWNEHEHEWINVWIYEKWENVYFGAFGALVLYGEWIEKCWRQGTER